LRIEALVLERNLLYSDCLQGTQQLAVDEPDTGPKLFNIIGMLHCLFKAVENWQY